MPLLERVSSGIWISLLSLVVSQSGSGSVSFPRQEQVPQAPQIRHDVRVINIEVPVRVFKGDSFVDHLTLGDFEVLEDGVPQNVEAVYLVKNKAVARKEENRTFSPDTSRTFFLFFIIYEYDAKLREALKYFVDNVLTPEDQLFVVTSRKTYRLKKELVASAPKVAIADQLAGLLRRDILAGEMAYRNILSRLKQMSGSKVRPIEGQMIDPSDLADMGYASEEAYMMQYRSDLDQLERLRQLDESQLFNFADHLKSIAGQKHVFVFYQREFIPTPSKGTTIAAINNPVLSQLSSDVSGLYRKMTSVAFDRLKSAYADSSVTIDFLFLTTIPTDISRDQMEERQWDVYQAFSEMAHATGGIVSSSSNPAYLMGQAAAATDNYYLLYYAPKDKTADGKFRMIEVRTKSGSYRIEHMAGYLAK